MLFAKLSISSDMKLKRIVSPSISKLTPTAPELSGPVTPLAFAGTNMLCKPLRVVMLIPFIFVLAGMPAAAEELDDDRVSLGVYTIAIAEAKELSKFKPPKIGVVVLGVAAGSDFAQLRENDIITHLNRDVLKTPDDIVAKSQSLDLEKKHKLSVQRFLKGKWTKFEVEFKPKTHRQLIFDCLVEDRDSVRGVSTFRDKNSPDSPAWTNLQCRIVNDGSGDKLYIRYAYNGKDWLFIESATVQCDGVNTEVQFGEVKRDHNSEVWEWCTRPATLEDHELVLQIALSKATTVRFNGKTYRHDHQITASEKQSLRNVLEAYRLRQKLNKNP